MKLTQFMSEDPALQRAAIKMGKGAFKHKWQPQALSDIDPVKDAEGYITQVKNGLSSPRRIQAQNGRRWEDVAREQCEDNAMAIRIAKETAKQINEEFVDGSPVHWRDVSNIPTSEGMQGSLITPVNQQAPEDEQAVDNRGKQGKTGTNE